MDDDPLVLRSLTRVLGGAFEIVTARSCAEAIHALGTSSFALLLCDLSLDGETGHAALEAARSLHPSMPRVLFSSAAAYDRQRLIDSGLAQVALAKTTPPGELLGTLLSIVAKN